MWSALALTVAPEQLGSACGVCVCVQNLMLGLASIVTGDIVGAIGDFVPVPKKVSGAPGSAASMHDPGSGSEVTNQTLNFRETEHFFALLATIACFLGAVLTTENGKNSLLNLPSQDGVKQKQSSARKSVSRAQGGRSYGRLGDEEADADIFAQDPRRRSRKGAPREKDLADVVGHQGDHNDQREPASPSVDLLGVDPDADHSPAVGAASSTMQSTLSPRADEDQFPKRRSSRNNQARDPDPDLGF